MVKHLKYNVVKNMTTVVDNVFKCITLEICMEKKKNIIVKCIYRTPGSNIETFKDWMEEVFGKVKQKDIFICGDFSI